MAELPLPCWAVKEKLVGLAPIAGEGVGDGVGVDEVGVMSWLIPGISESSRPNPLEALAVEDEPPDAAAVSPVVPDTVLLDAEDKDDCTAVFPVIGAADETEARLLCCVLLVWVRDPEVAGCAAAVFVVVLLTGICSDSDDPAMSVEAAEGATVAIFGEAGFLMRL